jgi:hypothetical protein
MGGSLEIPVFPNNLPIILPEPNDDIIWEEAIIEEIDPFEMFVWE